MKDSFVVYNDLLESTEDLTDAQVGQLFRAMMQYSATDEVPEIEDGEVRVAFKFIKRGMDENTEKYEKKVRNLERNREKSRNQSEITETNLNSDRNQDEIGSVPVPDPVPVPVLETEPEPERDIDPAAGEPKKKKTRAKKTAVGWEEKSYFDDPAVDEKFHRWLEERRKDRMSDYAIELGVKSLRKLVEQECGGWDPNYAVAAIDKAILSHWKSFYPVRDNHSSYARDGTSGSGLQDWLSS